MPIDADYWLIIANERSPQDQFVTPWFSGHIAPVRPGYYERHYTDGTHVHYWSGSEWRGHKYWGAHWRQVGDYPAWRGLKKPYSTETHSVGARQEDSRQAQAAAAAKATGGAT